MDDDLRYPHLKAPYVKIYDPMSPHQVGDLKKNRKTKTNSKQNSKKSRPGRAKNRTTQKRIKNRLKKKSKKNQKKIKKKHTCCKIEQNAAKLSKIKQNC